MMNFYGGQPGRNFYISEVFSNREELETDLKKMAASSIGVDEFVIISYGKADSETYANNKEIDQGNYNGCFYQKVYDQNGSNGEFDIFLDNSGWGYRFITQMSGQLPVFQKHTIVEISQNVVIPQFEILTEEDGANPDNPIMKITLPQPNIESNVISSLETSNVNLDLNTGLKFNFNIAKGSQFFNIKSIKKNDIELSFQQVQDSYPNAQYGDYFIETDTNTLYQLLLDNNNTIWQFITTFQGAVKMVVNEVTDENQKNEITVKTVEENGRVYYEYGIPVLQGKSGIIKIWSGHNPITLVGETTQENSVKAAIENYLNEKSNDVSSLLGQALTKSPIPIGEAILPISYIFNYIDNEIENWLAEALVVDENINIAENSGVELSNSDESFPAFIQEAKAYELTPSSLVFNYYAYAIDYNEIDGWKWAVFLMENEKHDFSNILWDIITEEKEV